MLFTEQKMHPWQIMAETHPMRHLSVLAYAPSRLSGTFARRIGKSNNLSWTRRLYLLPTVIGALVGEDMSRVTSGCIGASPVS
jgi:hypothetical protein